MRDDPCRVAAMAQVSPAMRAQVRAHFERNPELLVGPEKVVNLAQLARWPLLPRMQQVQLEEAWLGAGDHGAFLPCSALRSLQLCCFFVAPCTVRLPELPALQGEIYAAHPVEAPLCVSYGAGLAHEVSYNEEWLKEAGAAPVCVEVCDDDDDYAAGSSRHK